MRTMSGVSKNRHGVYYARKKVPKQLEQATAEILGNGKSRQVFLKRSLHTKDLREANIRAKPVLIEFDKILAQAEALTVQRPMRTTLEKREIKRVPLVPTRFQGCSAGRPRQRGPARRTHGSHWLLGGAYLRGEGHGQEVRSGNAGRCRQQDQISWT
jgi:hypothetical protein